MSDDQEPKKANIWIGINHMALRSARNHLPVGCKAMLIWYQDGEPQKHITWTINDRWPTVMQECAEIVIDHEHRKGNTTIHPIDEEKASSARVAELLLLFNKMAPWEQNQFRGLLLPGSQPEAVFEGEPQPKVDHE